MFEFPSQYNGEDKSTPITDEMLAEVAIESGILDVRTEDYPYLNDELKTRCKEILPNSEELVKSEEAADAFCFFVEKCKSFRFVTRFSVHLQLFSKLHMRVNKVYGSLIINARFNANHLKTYNLRGPLIIRGLTYSLLETRLGGPSKDGLYL